MPIPQERSFGLAFDHLSSRLTVEQSVNVHQSEIMKEMRDIAVELTELQLTNVVKPATI